MTRAPGGPDERPGLSAQAAVHAFSALGIVAQTAATFLGLLLVTFLIGRVLPIDPVLAAVGERASADVYEKVRIELGLNLPLHVQFWNYAVKVFHGDLGRSVLTANPVLSDIRRVFPATLELATLGTLFGVAFGVPIGVVAAARRGRWVDRVARVVALTGYSVPIFWLGLMGLLLFYARLGWVQGPGRVDVAYDDLVAPLSGALLLDSAVRGAWEVFKNAFGHIVLPAAVLGWLSLAYISRMTR
ncbi:MAG: ABC transporter permease, partial [Myxococcales bacterium]